MKNIMLISLSIVYPHDCVADWELWLTVAAQHPERISYHISLAQEKIKSQSTVFTERLSLTHHHKVKKNHELNHCQFGTVLLPKLHIQCNLYQNPSLLCGN